MTTRSVAPPRRRPKRVLTVRMLVAKLAWLEGRPHWREGQVVWEAPDGCLTPGAADLARAQRTLTRLESYPYAAREALGDSEAWLKERRARLELAKRLRDLAEPDLAALAQRARNGEARAIERLAALLCAEAVCPNPLPVAPSGVLLAAGGRAAAPLRALVEDGAAPRPARALAALVLGALHRTSGTALDGPSAPGDAWLRRAGQWGRRAGLPMAPVLVVALLADERGTELAERCLRATAAISPFCLDHDLLRDLLADHAPPSRVVELAEAALAAVPLREQLLQRRRELPDRASPQRRAVAEELRRQREQAVADLAGLLQAYARSTRDPAVLRRMIAFVELMLALGRVSVDLIEAILRPLRRGLELPAELQDSWLNLLVDHHSSLWNLDTLPKELKTRRGGPRIGAWLELRWNHEVQPVLEVLQATGSAEIVREALELGIHGQFARRGWRDPALHRLSLTLVRQAGPSITDSLVRLICYVINCIGDAPTARSVLLPLAQAAAGAPRPVRHHFLQQVLDEAPYGRQASIDFLARVTPYVPRLLNAPADAPGQDCLCGALASAAVALDRDAPAQASVWLDWLISHLAVLARRGEWSDTPWSAVQRAVGLGVALADGDLSRFQAIVSIALEHSPREDDSRLEQGLGVLGRFPGLRAPLAREYPRQPHRIGALLVRLGLASRLDADALGPLWDLERPVGEEVTMPPPSAPGDGWLALHELAPELAVMASAYRHAQLLLGREPGLPAGVRRAMALPERLAGELGFLQRRLEEQPDRADLAARAGTLRGRLADPETLSVQVRAEVKERLEHATAVAQIDAAEGQVLACFRRRLESVVGSLPAGLRLDDDLLNATLLTVDIIQNRRLLVKLLRHHLAGDRNWREQHPANAAFLQSLGLAGINVNDWLAAHPRRYPCAVAGGRVHLRFERDPLRILQMGNYFDTCLSFGGCNSFSTVANACELNKRVVYATDAAGHVVGRKLIAIDAEGALVGFRTYSSLLDDAGNQALRAIFRHYVRGFAERCGLPLANRGTVPRLFAQEWYDDGIIAWDDEEETPTGWSSSRPQPRPK